MLRILIYLLLIHLDVSTCNCPALTLKKGVNLECKLPGNATISDCTAEVPEGTHASFNCSKYYMKNEDPRQGEMICVDDSVWEHFYDYDDFHCTIQCGVTSRLTPVIVGGSQASKYDFPWHATIFLRNRTNDLFDLNCGGSLIDLMDEGPLILTAAHCLGSNLEEYRVILGANTSIFLENKDQDSQIFGVSYYERYPSYNFTSMDDDIAVIKLNGDIVYSNAVRPVCLKRGTSNFRDGDIGFVAGFGKTEEGKISKALIFASLPARSRSECEQYFPVNSKINFPATKFCSGFRSQNNVLNGSTADVNEGNKINPGICFGDSGGGLVKFNTYRNHSSLVGIAHAAFKDPQFACSGLGYFQSVGKYIGWIREVQEIVYPKTQTLTDSEYSEGVEILGSRCGSNPDWVEYKDEKCFRLVKQWVTKEDATKTCGVGFGAGNSLPILKSSEEYAFFLNFLKGKLVRNGVWLGASRTPLGFHWDNGDGLGKFSKWTPNRIGEENCSIILPKTGFWVEEDCEAENLIICQKLQKISSEELLQRIINLNFYFNETVWDFLEFRKGTQEEFEKQKLDLVEVRTKLENTTSKLNEAIGKLEDTKTKLEEATEKLENANSKFEDTTAKLEMKNAGLLQNIINLKAKINESRLELERNLREKEEKILNLEENLEETKSRLISAGKEIIDNKLRMEALTAKLNIFIEKQSSIKAVLDSILSKEPATIINIAGSRVPGLSTGTWYTFANKNFEGVGSSYMTWMLEGTIKFGQISHKREYVDKYQSDIINNFDAQWMIRKTSTPETYTLYNRGAKGYLMRNTDDLLRIVEETELTSDDGHWCFTADKRIYFRIHLCKVTKDGKGSLNFLNETEEGFKLKVYPMNSTDRADFWKANAVDSI